MKLQRIFYIGLVCSFFLLPLLSACSATQKPASAEPAPVQPVENPKPVVSSLSAFPPQVQPLATSQIICEATDTGGDNLTYVWAATGGTLTGTDSTVTWTAPQESGAYTISVTVTNRKGGSAAKTLSVTVPEKPNSPPVISAIRFTRQGRLPITVKTNMTEDEKKKLPELVIQKYQTADISCLATDPDNDVLDYKWMASGGKLVGNGASIQWIAAGDPGLYTIVVEVSDKKGGTASSSIIVSVHCCSG